MDFSSMQFQIHGKKQSVVDLYPGLLSQPDMAPKIIDLVSDLELDKILRYFIYLYDPGSPVRSIKNWVQRQDTAQDLAKMKADSLDNPCAEKVERAILAEMNDMDWVRYVSLETMFHNLASFVRQDISALDLDKLALAQTRQAESAKKLGPIAEEIKDLREKIMGKVEQDQASSQNIYSPESMAE